MPDAPADCNNTDGGDDEQDVRVAVGTVKTGSVGERHVDHIWLVGQHQRIVNAAVVVASPQQLIVVAVVAVFVDEHAEW